MYFEDLTDYAYHDATSELKAFAGRNRRTIRLLNIGWLDGGIAFPRGSVDDSILLKLFELAHHPRMVMRGTHTCHMCGVNEKGLGYGPTSFTLENKTVLLGNGELWVPGVGNIVYSSPTLLLHYIREHNYCPPAEFLEAVKAMPVSFGVENTIASFRRTISG